MVAVNRKRIHCVVITVPYEADAWTSRGVLAHDLLPDADPYVAQLIKRLQDEVRDERRARPHVRHGKLGPINRLAGLRSPTADLEIPWLDTPADDDPFVESLDDLPEFGCDPNDDTEP